MKHIDELLDEIIKNYDEETIAHANALELKQVLTNCFKVMLAGKDEHAACVLNKIVNEGVRAELANMYEVNPYDYAK